MRKTCRVFLVTCLLVMSSMVPAVAQTAGTTASIEDVTYSGTGNVSISESELYLWQSVSHQFTATISTASGVDGELCLVTVPVGTETEREVTCRPIAIPPDTTETKTISVNNWPADMNGSQKAGLLVRSGNRSEVITRESFPLTVIRKGGDLDSDDLTNGREASLRTRLRTADTDDDGLSDGMEVHTYETSPLRKDTDGDGLSDRVEIRTHGTDPTTTDTDGDGLPDPREIKRTTNPIKRDTDGDGVDDGAEVNIHGTEPTDPDTDSDGLGDGAEINDRETNPLQPDTDDDDLPDNLEVNTYGTAPTKIDTDGDGLEDGTEINEFQTDPTKDDTDEDGLIDGQEVRTYGTIPTNPDTDSDGLQDGAEINRYGTNPTTVDTDNDGKSDYVEARGQGWVSLRPLISGIVGTAVVILVGGGVLYRSGRLSVVSLRELRELVPADVMGTDTGPSDNQPADETPADEVPSEFLSDEEQILRVLDDHGGRMRQSDIVDKTDWSKSKVSRVLTEMEEDGRIAKVDVGRGNIISRPEDLPSGAQSPFEK